MGFFMEEITLENVLDRGFAEQGYIKDSDIRAVTVKALPDTGAWTLIINEEIRFQLGLGIEGAMNVTLANGEAAKFPVTGPVKIHWKNRSATLSALVSEHAKSVLLGVLPLEALDLIVDPVNQQLVGAHGDEPVACVY
jgi:clan AA aspartic protease